MTMSNRLAVMNDGRVQQFDTPLRCYNLPANRFVAGFIGSPSMNFIDGRTTSRGLTTPYFDLTYDKRTDGPEAERDVTVGVRPEDVAIVENREDLANPSEPISATVDVIEPVGNEIFLYLLIDEQEGSTATDGAAEMLVSIPPNPDWDLEETRKESVDICIDLARVHLFDADTGDAILHGLTGDISASSQKATGD